MKFKKKNGFTLIELLVVISIIAILMAIMMPALSRAKQQAQRLTCTSRLKDIGVMVNVYAADNNGNFPTHFGPDGESESRYRWTTKLGTYYDRVGLGGDAGVYNFDMFRCPTEEKIAKQTPNTPASIYGLNYYFVGAASKATQWRARDIIRPSELPLIGDLSSEVYANMPIGGEQGIVGYVMYPYYPHPKAFGYGYLGGDLQGNRTKFSYNGPAPNHNGRTNYLFADGHVDNLGYWPWEGVHDGTPFHPIRNPKTTK